MTKKTRAKARRALLTLSLVLVVAFAAVGGTIAWLTDSTQSVVNTFNGTKVDITLDETTGNEYDIVPGVDIPKDPAVTVYPGSEACYVFVKVEKANNFDTYCSYEMNAEWTLVPGEENVYYLSQVAIADDGQSVEHEIIKDNIVKVDKELTQNTLKALYESDAQMPTLTFTAYAIQSANTGEAKAAWDLVKNETNKYYTTTTTVTP